MAPPKHIVEGYNRWLASRPESVQRLAKRFPIGEILLIDDVRYYLLGYTENDMLIVSKIDPVKHYNKATKAREYICASHLQREPDDDDPAAG